MWESNTIWRIFSDTFFDQYNGYFLVQKHHYSPFSLVLAFCPFLTLFGPFLGPRGPLVLPLVGPVRPVRPSALKIWITYIQAYMPYES